MASALARAGPRWRSCAPECRSGICAFPDAAKRSAAHCRAADFSAGSGCSRLRGNARAGAAQLHQGRRSDPHAVAGLSDLLRRAGHRDRAALHAQEGRRERELVARAGACRARTSMRRFHYAENGAAVEAIAAEQLVVPLAVVDVSAKAARNADYALTQAGPRRVGRQARPAAGRLLRRDALRLGAARKRCREVHRQGCAPASFHFPGIHSEAAEWLLKERRVVGLAVDTLSLDPGSSKDFRTHTLWLPAGPLGASKTSPTSTRCRRRARRWSQACRRCKDATGGPARILALV